jgi:RNA polymerase sigma-70 factor (ECF subfamily)
MYLQEWHPPAPVSNGVLENAARSDYLICGGTEFIEGEGVSQDVLYQEAADTCGASLQRLAHAYEADPETRRDLLQDIHLQLWRSFAHFDRRCSLRTWVYRVAHNVATRHVIRQRRVRKTLVSIEEIESMPSNDQSEFVATQNEALERLSVLMQKLKPLDRQIIVSYLEGLDAASTAEITGLSAANVAMKVHRIKNVLKRWFHEGEFHAG